MFIAKRFAHILPIRKSSTIPCNFIFFDTETHIEGKRMEQGLGKHVLWFGWAYAFRLENGKRTREVWTRFTTSKEFFALVKKRAYEGKPLFVYGHNLGFDLPVVGFFENFKKEGLTSDFYTFDSPPTIFKCKYKKSTITFVDTLNYWTTSLAKLGDTLGITKLPMPKMNAPKEKWDRYCKRDVEVIAEAITRLCDFSLKHHCGALGLTIASLSMNCYRHRFMKHDIYIHDRLKVCALEREAYYGGLVEAFYIGKVKDKPIYKLDINSHYPAMMLKEFPTKLIEEYKTIPIPRLLSLLKRNAVVARVTISSKRETFPKRHNKKLVYCNGVYETTLCGPELQRAIDTNSILKIWHVAIYERERIFKAFVEYFWSLRQDYKDIGDEVNEYFVKILMNSLYGKFGQRGSAWCDVTEMILNELASSGQLGPNGHTYNLENIPIVESGYSPWSPEGAIETLMFRNIVDGMQIKIAIPEHRQSFPAIAAYVTSYGRERLLELIRIAGERNVFYCDTDSLFVNATGYRALKRKGFIDPKRLGYLKVEAKTDHCVIRGLKDYTFGTTTRIKGIRADAKQLSPNSFEQLRFDGIKGILRRERTDYVEVKKIIKKLKRKYDKGHILPSGWTLPLTLPV